MAIGKELRKFLHDHDFYFDNWGHTFIGKSDKLSVEIVFNIPYLRNNYEHLDIQANLWTEVKIRNV